MPAVSSGEYRGIAHVTPTGRVLQAISGKVCGLISRNGKAGGFNVSNDHAGGRRGTLDRDYGWRYHAVFRVRRVPGAGVSGRGGFHCARVKYLATEVFNKAGLLEDPYNMEKPNWHCKAITLDQGT